MAFLKAYKTGGRGRGKGRDLQTNLTVARPGVFRALGEK